MPIHLKIHGAGIALECNEEDQKIWTQTGCESGDDSDRNTSSRTGIYILHVGDGRVYEFTGKGTKILTKDQTYVAREAELGHMTVEQAKNDSRKSVLLQCIGSK